MKYRINGFSLIELMVAVVIVGILAAVAMPSYQNYVIKGSRAAAQTELLELASLQEKIYLNSSSYTANVATPYTGNSTGGLGKTGGKTSDGKYDITFVGTPSQTFTIKATPAAGKSQVGNGCLTIQENGMRQWDENVDACSPASASRKSW